MSISILRALFKQKHEHANVIAPAKRTGNGVLHSPGDLAQGSAISFALLAFVSLLLGHATAAAADLHAGFLFDEFNLTLDQGRRSEAVGPLYYQQERDTEKTWAFPPLLSSTYDPETDAREFDLLYPIMAYDRYGTQYRWKFCELLAFTGGPTQTDPERHRFSLFPLYFQQRSTKPEDNYTAFVPFYGHIQHRLFRDEIFFVMFPIFGETRKADVVTDNYFYPLVHVRHGEGLDGWQFWPFVGHEHKDVTFRTNAWQEPETVAGHEKLFVLWPLFFDEYTGLGTANPAWEQSSFPAYSFTRSPKRDSTYVLWLFGHVTDREKKYREWDLPWPFIEFARGEGKTTDCVFPFFSQSHSATLEDNYYLWPIYKYDRARLPPLDHQRTRILFFLYSDTLDKDTEGGRSRRRVDLWPLFTHHRDYNGNTRLQILAPLEPLVSGSHKIVRDWSPLWSLWRAEHNPRTGASSQSLLWNLYRREVTPERKHVSALFGLFQRESGTHGTSLSLLYIPLKRAREPKT